MQQLPADELGGALQEIGEALASVDANAAADLQTLVQQGGADGKALLRAFADAFERLDPAKAGEVARLLGAASSRRAPQLFRGHADVVKGAAGALRGSGIDEPLKTAAFLQFYSYIGNANGREAAASLDSATLTEGLLDYLTPFGEVLAYDDPKEGGNFLKLLQDGRRALHLSRDTTRIKSAIERIIAERTWPQLLYLSDLLRQNRFSHIFSESKPPILANVALALSTGDYTPLMQAIAFRRAQGIIDDVIKKGGDIVVITGAGISAESGVHTYREGGQTFTWRGIPLDQIANARTLSENPNLLWEFDQWQRSGLEGVEANRGHLAIAELEAAFGHRVTVITQNGDGLHWRAGSQRVIELHGNLRDVRCTAGCGFSERLERHDPNYGSSCKDCGAPLRSGVVLFGERLDNNVYGSALDAVDRSSVLLVVGTSGVVQPAASLVTRTRMRNVPIILINLEPTDMTPLASVFIQGKAGEVFPYLLAPNIYADESELINIIERTIALAARHVEHSRFDRAVSLLTKAVEIAKAGGRLSLLSTSGHHLVDKLEENGRGQMEAGDYSQAETSLYLALTLSLESDLQRRGHLLMQIAEYYLLEGESLQREAAIFQDFSKMGALAARAAARLDEALTLLGNDVPSEIGGLRKRAAVLRGDALRKLSSRP